MIPELQEKLYLLFPKKTVEYYGEEKFDALVEWMQPFEVYVFPDGSQQIKTIKFYPWNPHDIHNYAQAMRNKQFRSLGCWENQSFMLIYSPEMEKQIGGELSFTIGPSPALPVTEHETHLGKIPFALTFTRKLTKKAIDLIIQRLMEAENTWQTIDGSNRIIPQKLTIYNKALLGEFNFEGQNQLTMNWFSLRLFDLAVDNASVFRVDFLFWGLDPHEYVDSIHAPVKCVLDIN